MNDVPHEAVAGISLMVTVKWATQHNGFSVIWRGCHYANFVTVIMNDKLTNESTSWPGSEISLGTRLQMNEHSDTYRFRWKQKIGGNNCL